MCKFMLTISFSLALTRTGGDSKITSLKGPQPYIFNGQPTGEIFLLTSPTSYSSYSAFSDPRYGGNSYYWTLLECELWMHLMTSITSCFLENFQLQPFCEFLLKLLALVCSLSRSMRIWTVSFWYNKMRLCSHTLCENVEKLWQTFEFLMFNFNLFASLAYFSAWSCAILILRADNQARQWRRHKNCWWNHFI